MSEEALWNNSFYSSTAHISQSSSANHISALRKSVALPHSVSSNSIAAVPLDAATEKEVLTQKTSFMTPSPSMKALERMMNDKSANCGPDVAVPDAIAEEEEPLVSNSPEAPVASVFDKPGFSNANYTYHNSGSRVSLRQSQHQPQPMASTSTFHTAPSSESVRRSVEGSDNIETNTQSDQNDRRYSSSISTIGESGYSVGTPKLDPPASFHTFKRTTKDYSPQLLTVAANPDKRRGSADSDHDTTAVEDTPVDEKQNSSYPSASNVTLKQPVQKELPEPPTAVEKMQQPNIQRSPENRDARFQGSPKRPVKSLLDVEPLSHTQEALQPPFQDERLSKTLNAAESFKKDKLTRSSPEKSTSSPSNISQKMSSSAFGTPRSKISSQFRRNSVDINEKEAHISPRVHKRSNTVGDISAVANSQKKQGPEPLQKKAATNPEPSNVRSTPGAGASKRFSFRGLFKIKSKNHSLDKVKEDSEMGPSKPTKIKSKSYSSPSFSTLVGPSPGKNKSEKRESKNIFGGFKRKKSEVPELSTKNVESKNTSRPNGELKIDSTKQLQQNSKPSIPQTPTTPGSLADMDTPATTNLEPTKEGPTIREVDDSDYNFEYTKASHAEEHEVSEADDTAKLVSDPPKRHSNQNYGEELTLEPTPQLALPDFQPSDRSFGSPLLKYKFNETPKSKAAQSNRSSLNPPKSDQLLGEALFPKSLNTSEIENIVSLERSRSMRSIKSNSKRSSFINYNGSDENVIVYSGEAGQNSPSTMRRSGSILKNSSSMNSLNGVVHSIDKAVSDSLLPSPIEHHEREALDENILQSALDFMEQDTENENLHDFIEFTDFIDVDNLDFPASPMQFDQQLSPVSEPSGRVLDSSLELKYSETINDRAESRNVAQPEKARELTREGKSQEDFISSEHSFIPASPNERQDESIQPVLTAEAPAQENGKIENSFQRSKTEDTVTTDSELPSLVIVEEKPDANEKRQEPEPSTPTLGLEDDDALKKSPILGTAYKMALNEAVARNSPNNASRPISMSFKGFKGPAISKQAIAKTGSHQSLNMNDSSNESSAVGQGFGSSDDDDDSEDDFSSEDESENNMENGFTGLVKKPLQAPGLKSTGNAANRGVPSPKLMGLHPPKGPFGHDRVPSLSDQSTTSSPRSLTSFISRIRKSPMASPKVQQQQQYKTEGVRFSSRIILYDTYNCDEYDRHPDIATCNQLTPMLAQQIREELNEIKSQMEVHHESQCYTHFF
ncbi:bud neck involved protein [Candidozyma auris]|uniref:Protein BNI4 n=2 Tax=Candidozyma auris TaxID=498019 RepID=A0A2H0ZCC6_CANAR|nr:hypothetical protein QG37_01107 [[Candida] auris]PIS48299.1 hypothetical protein B9J08_004985 [[Candida] auris]QWW24907.1 hypothetical protein CA7LBN_003764 [[Candida] auris]